MLDCFATEAYTLQFFKILKIEQNSKCTLCRPVEHKGRQEVVARSNRVESVAPEKAKESERKADEWHVPSKLPVNPPEER